MPDWTVRAPGAATDQNDQGADQAPPETSTSQTPAAPKEDPMVALAREAADYKDKLLRSLAIFWRLPTIWSARSARSTQIYERKPTPEPRRCSTASSSPSASC